MISGRSGDNLSNRCQLIQRPFGGWANLGRSNVSVPPITVSQPISASKASMWRIFLRQLNVHHAFAPADHKGLRRVGSPVRSTQRLGRVAE
jgi:hypothetical protein